VKSKTKDTYMKEDYCGNLKMDVATVEKLLSKHLFQEKTCITKALLMFAQH
jgi:hypothetical protein